MSFAFSISSHFISRFYLEHVARSPSFSSSYYHFADKSLNLPDAMAIHADYPGLVAEEVVQGIALKEYHDSEVEALRTTTIYIQATSGENLTIMSTIPRLRFDTCGVAMVVKIDGEIMRRDLFIHKTYTDRGKQGTIAGTRARVDGKTMTQTFRFDEVKTGELLLASRRIMRVLLALSIDETTCESDQHRLAAKRQVTLSFYRATNVRQRTGPVHNRLPSLKAASERSAMSHTIGYHPEFHMHNFSLS